ncbi:MAG: glycosyltransferase family 39 protein [Firmicutes bacterium]|nr:glycosyltransferase family 39 protein [Bacillota bacterium]
MQIIPSLIGVIVALATIAFFVIRIPAVVRLEAPADDPASLFSFPRRRYPMRRKDILPLLLIVAVYAVVAFWGLGDKTAPETFYDFESSGSTVQLELKEPTDISNVMYYSGLRAGDYTLQFSADGQNFTDVGTMRQEYGDLFKWNTPELTLNIPGVRVIRIVANTQLELGELALYDGAGNLIPTDQFRYDAGAAALFDEQSTIPPEGRTYLNSTYFDEIYHARTAFEFIRIGQGQQNLFPYETTHPPLGKLIIAGGILIQGMNPFGWRLMGVIFGILMLPFLYVLLKNLFGSTTIAACGTLIFAFDFMHYVQTRIATIDTYGVFFILAMTFFLYRWLTADPDNPKIRWWRRSTPLFLAGLMFGLGAASKWIVIYAGGGAFVILLIYWIKRGIELCRAGRRNDFLKALFANLVQLFVFFILIPAAIYYVSYWPFGMANGLSDGSLSGSMHMLLNPKYLKIVLDNQAYMYQYHSTLVATHPYSSVWWWWLFDWRPILYYLNYPTSTTVSAFAAFTNPILTWGGLICMVFMAYRIFWKKDGRALFILIGYLAQLIPWMDVSRITFAYHYFPSTIFLTLAVCHFFNILRSASPRWKRSALLFTGACLFLFVMFYPKLSGVAVPRWYGTYLLQWLPSWPF